MAPREELTAQEIFGRNVRKLRQRKKWTQEDLAEITGLHRAYVGHVERGERNIPIVNMAILAEALEVKLSVLLRGA